MLQVLDSYLKIQASLANDSLDGVQAEAAQIAKLSADKEIKILAQTMSHNTLDAARVDFKKLSVAMATWAQKAKPKDLARLSCSMANASWLQKKGATRNPYYGKQMLECGEVLP